MRNCIGRETNARTRNAMTYRSKASRAVRHRGASDQFRGTNYPHRNFVTCIRYYYRDNWIRRFTDTAVTIADELWPRKPKYLGRGHFAACLGEKNT